MIQNSRLIFQQQQTDKKKKKKKKFPTIACDMKQKDSNYKIHINLN